MDNIRATLLVITGWALFLICLLLPALYYDEKVALGINAWFLAFEVMFDFRANIVWIQNNAIDWIRYSVSGIGNIFMILSVFTLAIRNVKIIKLFSAVFSMLFLVSTSYFFEYQRLGDGYYMWVVSFLVAASGYIVAYKSSQA